MMTRETPLQGWTRWTAACGILAAIAWYGFFLYRHVLNVPYQDDIFDVLQVLTRVLQATDLQQAFGILFDNYNEHRTLASRLVYYLVYLVTGEANFRTLVFLSNLSLVAQLYMLYLAMGKRYRSLWLLLPAALILLQPRAYGLYSISMGAFAYMFVYLYGFASLLCLRDVTALRFLAALAFATLGTFTLASGQLIWLVGLASLLQQAFVQRRCSLAYALCWLACAVLVLVSWRIGYETSNTLAVVFTAMLDSPLHHLAFLFTLMGAAVTNASVVFASMTGCVLFAAVIYWSFRNRSSADISLELFAWYVVLTMVAITVGRALVVTPDYALESRLSFPSELLLAVVVLMCVSRISNPRRQMGISALVVLVAGIYWLTSFRIYPAYMQEEFEDRVADYNAGNYWVIYFPVEETNNIVAEAIALGIYRPPARPLSGPDIAP
jgi:hypothetical protein